MPHLFIFISFIILTRPDGCWEIWISSAATLAYRAHQSDATTLIQATSSMKWVSVWLISTTLDFINDIAFNLPWGNWAVFFSVPSISNAIDILFEWDCHDDFKKFHNKSVFNFTSIGSTLVIWVVCITLVDYLLFGLLTLDSRNIIDFPWNASDKNYKNRKFEIFNYVLERCFLFFRTVLP